MADNVRRELERWGNWMKRRRPRPKLEALEPQLLIRYIEQRLGITQALIEALVKDIANDFYRIKFTDTALVTETETLRIAYYLQVENVYAEPGHTWLRTSSVQCCAIREAIHAVSSEEIIRVDQTGEYVLIENAPDEGIR
jgi:hypothetical protein